jgi:Ca2+-transporting ATPase
VTDTVPVASPESPAPAFVASGAANARPIGLSAAEARRRLDRDGFNELPRADHRSLLRIVVEVMREPMFLLLSAAAALYLVLGDVQEALVLCASVVVVVGVTVRQAGKSERALEALRDLSSPRAAVVRDGNLARIAARELVVGDVIVLGEGDRMPADARVLACHDLRADESLLTGESMPVGKRPGIEGESAPEAGTPDSAWLYSSTLVVGGHATAEVTAIGTHTAVGRIGRALGAIVPERSPMQREVDRVVIVFAAIGLGLCGVVTILYLALRGGWVDALLTGITLAIANIPEEFPVVLTIFLALGAWRLARQQVLTRRAPAIETLGAITVLCADKTGTLTENRMAVTALHCGANRWTAAKASDASPPAFDELLRYAALASELTPFDPMEKAILATRPTWTDSRDLWTLVEEYPLTPELLAHTHVWRTDDRFVVACKGAPEAVADLCALPRDTRTALLADVAELARSGLRVIAAARSEHPFGVHGNDELPISQRGFTFEMLGLIGLSDPVRAGVREAVADAAAAGVRTVMLTGDYPETAQAVAAAAGLDESEVPLTGSTIATLDDEALCRGVARHCIFARVVPEQKLRLVSALKANGEIVAMTGDGVNDAPALRAAHVGIAMGGRGTDVAREAASIVLQDDNFVSIVRAIRIGRSIYDNIERALRYILAVHVPVTGLALLPLLVGGPLVFWPIHIVFLELVIDPACAVVFEREPARSDVMRRPPRDPRQRLFAVPMLLSSLIDGAAALSAAALVYLFSWRAGFPDALVASLTFASVVTGNLALIAVNRSGDGLRGALRASNAAFWWIVGLAALALTLSLYVAPLAHFFRFARPPVGLLLAALAAPLVSITAVCLARYFGARKPR